MIQKALDALAAMDSVALAACFSEDCKYFDYCPSVNGKENYFIYGSDCIEMFFRNRFAHEHLVVSEPRAEDANTGSYFGAYSGPYVFARIQIEEFDENGLIKKAVVHPA
jgi:hypothetical protein